MMTNRYLHRDPQVGISFLSEVHFEFAAPGKAHAHTEVQFLCILRGAVDVSVAGEDLTLRPGDVLIVPAGVLHSFPSTDRPVTVDLLDLRIDATSGSELSTHVRESSWPGVGRVSPHEAKRIAQQLLSDVASDGSARRAGMLGGVWTLLAAVMVSTHATAPTIERRIAVAERFMLEHLADPIGAPDIAETCALSVSQLNRLYRAHTGVGPVQRLRSLRIEHARERLVASLMSVKEIAFDCGFVCPNHFCRVFKSEVGLTPGEYRERGGAAVRA